MRKRLPKSFLTKVKGTEFVPDFYENNEVFTGKVVLEAEIESVYNNNTLRASKGKIDIIKKCNSDGFMRFRYNDKSVKFYGIQETKRGVKPSTCQITKQLIQIIGYYNNLGRVYKEDCKVFCINSAYFYGYILRSDIEDLINNVMPDINNAKVSPSRLYNECGKASSVIKKWVEDNKELCHIHLLSNKIEADSFEINKIIREIYLNCL